MGKCNIDHSLEDVKKKLDEQSSFLPADIKKEFTTYLEQERTQEQLNEAFHLLKKYDLAEEKERNDRNEKMATLFSQA
ncbi:group-specific protein [Desertibacillus haloalkaliphilus]|uniref:group-specific protein n=1 Tax=Desertibacillus haloalkaliphilus TaxID=1328930 RepID=UPI001C27A590|nr:group-specific protein [Desertibacillus haloalkaliphilus]MBU8908570.1 group-specific protein [Desertibacillus haloalkaliphilus]